MGRPTVLLPFQYVEDAASAFVALVLLEDVGRRPIRFLFSFKGELRAMAWMKVGSDGSLYLNPRLKASRSFYSGTAIADGAGGFVDIDLSEIDVNDLEDPNPKLSHHASGIVKRADRRSRGVSPRGVAANTLFRQDDYGHPSRFAIIPPGDVRLTDIVVPTVGAAPFELDEERPLTSRLMVAPLKDGAADVRVMNDAPAGAQTAVVLPYTSLVDCQDLTYQISFFSADAGPWPEMTMMAVLDVEQPALDDSTRPSGADAPE